MMYKLSIDEPFECDYCVKGDIIKIYDKNTLLFKSEQEIEIRGVKSKYFILSCRYRNKNFINSANEITVNGYLLTCEFFEDISKSYAYLKSSEEFLGTIKGNFSNIKNEKMVNDERDYFVEYSKNIISVDEMKYIGKIIEHKSIEDIKDRNLKTFIKTELYKYCKLDDCYGLVFPNDTKLSAKFTNNQNFLDWIKDNLNNNLLNTNIPTDIISFENLGDGYIYKLINLPNGDVSVILIEIYCKPNTEKTFYCIIHVKITADILQKL